MFSFQVVVFPAIAAILLLAVKQLFERYVSWRTANAPVIRSTTAPLPLDWYQNQDLYELEKRAVFSKKWLLVTHKSRLPENGSWVRYQDVANFQFFLVRDNDGNVNGFHNVCRHRAFPVVEGEKGKNMVLSCKYHGWSYGLKGNLAKAPGYQDMPAFDKSKNGLFKVHTHVDAKGFVWVNFDDSTEKPAAWANDVQDVDKFFRLEKFNLDEYDFDHVLEMNGNYNWKALGNNYNEWFHTMEADHIDVHHSTVRNYYFPNAAVTASPHFFYMMRVNPTSPTTSKIEYEIYRHKHASDAEFKKIYEVFQQLRAENEALSSKGFQGDSESSIIKKRPFYFEGHVRELVERHRNQEKAVKHVILPAKQVVPKAAAVTNEDDALCAGLCETDKKKLEW